MSRGCSTRSRPRRGVPKLIRTANGPVFAGRATQTWAAKNGVELSFIQPGRPVQNAYIESFNGQFRDECLSQHWFASLSHMRSIVDNWRYDYNHHRPHSILGYVPPALRKPPHQQRCKLLISRSKCYESRAAAHRPQRTLPSSIFDGLMRPFSMAYREPFRSPCCTRSRARDNGQRNRCWIRVQLQFCRLSA